MKRTKIDQDELIDAEIEMLKVDDVVCKNNIVMVNECINILCRAPDNDPRFSGQFWYWKDVTTAYHFEEDLNDKRFGRPDWAIKQAMREGFEIIVFDDIKEYALFLIETSGKK